jgi:23S rRNA (cytidine2498-2'-O)-methyltransferase
METLITSKEDFEKILANEAAAYQGKLLTKGRGWILVQWDTSLPKEICFACHILENPLTVSADSVNSLTEKLLDLFSAHMKEKRVTAPWPLMFSSSSEEQFIQHAKTLEKNWLNKLQKKMSRVAKLSQTEIPQCSDFMEGFFVHVIDFNKVYVSYRAVGAKQQRMQMDPQAPSRSYLKTEEAFRAFGHAPQKNNLVVDLGASPGGWSYSALKRGAVVIAVDNGPLKGSVALHPHMSHLQVDAFKYTYERSQRADWLFCDILEQPEVVLELLSKWLKQKWCRYFIVNLKLGRTDPVLLLKKIKDPHQGIASYCTLLSVKQLYHDREEITLMGEVKI